MGIVSCFGGYVFPQVPAETSWVSWCGTKLSTRYRSLDASYKFGEKGIQRKFHPKLLVLMF